MGKDRAEQRHQCLELGLVIRKQHTGTQPHKYPRVGIIKSSQGVVAYYMPLSSGDYSITSDLMLAQLLWATMVVAHTFDSSLSFLIQPFRETLRQQRLCKNVQFYPWKMPIASNDSRRRVVQTFSLQPPPLSCSLCLPETRVIPV